jgi:hypothetical protein
MIAVVMCVNLYRLLITMEKVNGRCVLLFFQSYKLLNGLGISVSYDTTITVLDELISQHDIDLKRWKKVRERKSCRI